MTQVFRTVIDLSLRPVGRACRTTVTDGLSAVTAAGHFDKLSDRAGGSAACMSHIFNALGA